ncbi:MAG: hypothetical protein V2A79_18115 [Planctomycetota bacterium]
MPTPPRPDRKHPTHGVFIRPNAPTILFLTVCTHGRQPWLATDENHALLRSVWTAATAWVVGRYVVMPDHIHLFAAPARPELPLESWVKYWKSQFTKVHLVPEHRWETDHWDTRLRKGENYAAKWEYVWNNPVRHGLVRRAEDWPFQGEMTPLEWW